VGTAGIGVTQKKDREYSIDQQHVFHRMACFLAAITARLCSRIVGALDAPFGAIMPKRGEADAGMDAAGGSAGVGGPSGGTIRAAASASATPRRFANSVTDRGGASPSVRSVACRTTNKALYQHSCHQPQSKPTLPPSYTGSRGAAAR
jgi:hypothetical protein